MKPGDNVYIFALAQKMTRFVRRDDGGNYLQKTPLQRTAKLMVLRDELLFYFWYQS